MACISFLQLLDFSIVTNLYTFLSLLTEVHVFVLHVQNTSMTRHCFSDS